MAGLTPACADDLPPVGKLIVDEPFWRHPAWGLARDGVAHLRIWTTAADPTGYVVTETGLGNSVTESAGRIWAGLVRWYGPSLVLCAIRRTDSPRAWRSWIWSGSAPAAARTGPGCGRAPQGNSRHAGLEAWMASYGHLIIGRPASYFDRCQDD